MSNDPFVEPGDPAEPSSQLRAADLLNLPCLVRVTGEGMWPAKPAHTDDQGVTHRAQPEMPYIEADVAVLGATGIENYASGVRISWRRVVPAQLNMSKLGRWVPCRPKQQDDRSIILTGFDERGKARARELLPEVEALFGPVDTIDTVLEGQQQTGEEPF